MRGIDNVTIAAHIDIGGAIDSGLRVAGCGEGEEGGGAEGEGLSHRPSWFGLCALCVHGVFLDLCVTDFSNG